jgi:hypothetical protein
LALVIAATASVVAALLTTAPAAMSSAPVGSMSNPVPLHHWASVGTGWQVRVNRVVWDAWPLIYKANYLNTRPRRGTTEVLIAISAKYIGHGASHFDGGENIFGVARSRVAYGLDNDCGVMPDPQIDIGTEVFRGGTETGWSNCWVVRNSDLASLVMYVKPLLLVSEKRTFFRLR